MILNDVHAQLNPTRVARRIWVDSLAAIQDVIRQAGVEGRAISVAGGRHAMGGQQLGTGTILVDMSMMDRVLAFDPARGEVEVEAGIQWPALIHALWDQQYGQPEPWTIHQKQTGADRLSLGGALASNVHGRGLGFKPIVADVESFALVDATGHVRRCSREEHPELFRLAIGGYGLFGVIASVRLRLRKRQKLVRLVTLLDVDELIEAFQRQMADGARYGDFQFAIDPASDQFLRTGILSCYRPVEATTPMPAEHKRLSTRQWQALIYLAHVHPRQAFAEYADYYLATSGQIYWSDLHQLSTYVDDYHGWLDHRMGTSVKSTEVITELYVPRQALERFLREVRADFRAHRVPVIYGTIRLIERDDETFLAWAKEPYACVIVNLHTEHTPAALVETVGHFRRLIDVAIHFGGSFYLTYHRFATRAQVEACYPQFPEFLRLKRAYDPDERFQSDWYRHYRAAFGGIRGTVSPSLGGKPGTIFSVPMARTT